MTERPRPLRYVLLCEGHPVATTDDPLDLVTALWGRQLQDLTAARWRYTVLDYEVPYVVDTPDLAAFLARLPVEAPRPRPAISRHPEERGV
jgi:hypothetical protein